MEGSIGRVTGIDPIDPDKHYILFDDDDIYQWLPKVKSLPSSWMESYETAQPLLDEDLVDWVAKGSILLFNAVDRGDLRIVKLLVLRHGLDVNARNADGMTPLQVACKEGYIEVVQWLLDSAGADMEAADSNGFRAIHHSLNKLVTLLPVLTLEDR